ncbi:T9SS type B sorting domain-containing protein [Aquimarina algicola]|uniref:T9SS type B sorting domain-containing protein n=1 Tax=Aquimarina algicola TaxID=2589995 RepID=A0A504J957_9FLAO|nr:T9SS type B sorting domain-containing protein [Aquimarina algicola]TPN87446.1 T9SS type B sorting domain-containing protein [Aquimarina algicola]
MKVTHCKKPSLGTVILILLITSFNLYAQDCLTVDNIGKGDHDNDMICDLYDLDDDNDGILDDVECGFEKTILNGSFEVDKLVAPRRWGLVRDSKVVGWQSSLSSRLIEFWGKDFQRIVAPDQDIIIELNSTNPSAVYQRLNIQPGDRIIWSVYHKGRRGVDKASVRIGTSLATAPVQQIMTTGRSNWKHYVGSYTVPAGQTNTLFILESVSTDRNHRSIGNLVDNVQVFLVKKCPDFDSDGIPNDKDLDSDNDGVYDVVEAGGRDDNDDGKADDTDNNTDNSTTYGIPSSARDGITPIDIGNDGTPDFLNLDSDSDGCSDADEAYNDPDADGNDTGVYGVDPATVSSDGLVTTAPYTDPVVIDYPVLKVKKRILNSSGNDITGGVVDLGEQVYYELTIENQGGEDIIDAVIKDEIPDNVSFRSGSFEADSGITPSYNATKREVEIIIDNTVIEKDDSPIQVRFKIDIPSSCIDLRDACSNEIKNTAFVTYTGKDSMTIIRDQESILSQDACLFDVEGASVFTIDVSRCDNNYEAFICTGPVDIAAGSGFNSYTWTNLDTGAVIGRRQNITISNGGRYKVDKVSTTGCTNLSEIWTVKAFNTIQNPVIAIAESAGVNGNVRTCPVTAEKFPELFLCGKDDEIYLNPPFVGANSITWERLDATACPSVPRDEDCPTVASACDSEWVQVANGSDFTIKESGEYRINASFDGGCTIPFYFNVYKNSFEPNLVLIQDVVCTEKGILSVQNSSNQYEYQLETPSGKILPVTGDVNDPDSNGYQDLSEFSGLTEKGNYKVNVRQKNGLPTACVFTATRLVNTPDPTAVITATAPECPSDTGEVLINVENGVLNYTYTVSSTTNTFTATEGPTTETNHTFTGLNPDTYTVEVLSYDGSCVDTQNVIVKESPAFSAVASLKKDLSCNVNYQPDPLVTSPAFDPDQFTALVKVNITGGSGSYRFSTSNTMTPVLSPEVSTTDEFRFTSAGVYTIFVEDLTTKCIIPAGSVTVSTYDPVSVSMTPVTAKCPGNDGSLVVNVTSGKGPFIYILDSSTFTAALNETTHTFNNVKPGSHNVLVIDRFGCQSNAASTTLEAPKAIEADIAITQEYRCDATGKPEQTATISVTNPKNGNGSYEYSIDGVDFSNTSGVFTGLKDGVYAVYIRDTDTHICPVNLGSLTVNPLQQVIDLDFNFSQVECPALTSDVTITPTATNAATAFEYRITAPALQVKPWQTSNMFKNLPAGTTYTFEARTTTDGCIYTENVALQNIDIIAVKPTVTKRPTCNTDTDGIISFTVTDIDFATTSYDYEVSGGTISGTITGNAVTARTTPVNGLGAGMYTITVTDTTTKCTATGNITITEPGAIAIDKIDVKPLTCINDAIVTVTASGGNGGIEFELKDGSNTTVAGPQKSNKFTIDKADTYTIIAKDNQSCSIDDTVIITTPPVLSATIENTSDLCYDTTDQSRLDISVSGGKAPFHYSVNKGAQQLIAGTTFSIANLLPDTYAIVITDANGCDVTLNKTIANTLLANAKLTKNLDCTGTPNATIDITNTGGTGPFMIEVSTDNGATYTSVSGGSPFSTNTAGTYIFKVKDNNDCEAITNRVVVEPTEIPALSATKINTPTCVGNADGSIEFTIDPSLGTPPYKINFNGAGFSNQTSYAGLAAGPYTYVIQDAKECKTTVLSVTVPDPAPITIGKLDKKDISCNEVTGVTKEGEVTLTGVSGGTGTYDYTLVTLDDKVVPVAGNPTLATTASTITFDNLAFGDYILRIVDSNGCKTEANFNIATKAIFTVTESAPTISCVGGVTIDITVTDGTGPFQIREYPSGTFGNLNGTTLPSSGDTNIRTHQISGLDFNTPFTYEILDTTTNCTDIRTIKPQPSPSSISIAIIETASSCNAADNGKVSYEITGYSGNELTYRLYSIVDLNTEITSGYTFSNGTIQSGPTGAAATGEITSFAPGTYQLRVFETDAGLAAPCNTAMQFTITEPEPVKLQKVSQKDGFCTKNPEVIVIATGGNGNFTYTANDGLMDIASNTNGIFNTLPQGTYTIRVEDQKMCTTSTVSVTLNTIADPVINPIASYDQCIFGSSYTFTAHATGAGQLAYSIDGVSFVDDGASHDFTVNAPGNYTISVRDVNGCITTETMVIYEDLIVNADFDNEPTCTTGDDIVATVAGGSDYTTNPTNFTFTLSGTDISGSTVNRTQTGNHIFTGVLAGDYELEVTDTGVNASGCSAKTKTTRVYTNPVLVLSDTEDISCAAANDGSILVALQSGTDTDHPFTYQLFDAITSTQVGSDQTDNPLFKNIAAGEYNVTVTSVFGCKNTLGPIEIKAPAILNAVATPTDYNCNASNAEVLPDIVVDITGGTAPYQLSYTGAASGTGLGVTGSQYTIDASTPGNYTITVKDKNNCTFTHAVIIIPDHPDMTATNVTTVTPANCNTNTETVTVSVTGGKGPFNFVEMSSAVTAQNNIASGGTMTTSGPFSLPKVGNYVFEIYDQGTGCSIITDTYAVVAYDTIEGVIVNGNNVSCANVLPPDGSIALMVSGHTGNYNYKVRNLTTGTMTNGTGDTTVNNPLLITGLEAGNLQVTVEDPTTGCDDDTNIYTISAPAAMDVSIKLITAGYCSSDNDAIIETVVTGGAGDFEYRLEDSSGTPIAPYATYTDDPLFESLNPATAGTTYQVRVKDKNGCEATEQITIVPPTEITILSAPDSTLSCVDSTDGVITVRASGGQGAGNYSFTLTYPDGSKSTDVTSATDSYSFTGLPKGEYIVTVFDNLNCEDSKTVTITTLPEVTNTVRTIATPSCTNPTAKIQVTGAGGTPPYQFSTDGITYVTGSNPYTFTGLTEGDYAFYVRDDNGCVSKVSNTVPVRRVADLVVTPDYGNTELLCFADTEGSINATVTGGLGDYMYMLQGTDYLGNNISRGPQNRSFFGNLAAGTYTYKVTSKDCTAKDIVFDIKQPTEFKGNVTPKNPTCFFEEDGSITVNVSGGTAGGYIYSLVNSADEALFTFINDNIDGVVGQHEFKNLASDTYRIEVTDAKGCSIFFNDIKIEDPAIIDVQLISTKPEFCAGDSNGSATVSITSRNPSGSVATSYLWSINGEGSTFIPVADPTNLVISDLPGGETELLIKDATNTDNCPKRFVINIQPGIALEGELTSSVECPERDQETGDVIAPATYTVRFEVSEETSREEIIYTLKGINGTPDPANNQNMNGIFTVTHGEYQGYMMNASGCERAVDTITVEEYIPLSKPAVQTTNNTSDVNEYEILTEGGTGEYTYFVTFISGDGVEQELESNIFFIRNSGEYSIRVVDATGCSVEKTHRLSYINLIIPNYFTLDSNGGRGWYPDQTGYNEGTPSLLEKIEVQIFDRYGRLLANYKGDQRNNGWKGFHQGRSLPSGDYWYMIVLNDRDQREFTGHFTLFRK